jgi:nitrile hydratase accessory protein
MDRAQETITTLTSTMPDTAAPPRKNGELVFEAPWQSRAFGMAIALHGEGIYSWKDFSAQLAAVIAASDAGAEGERADAIRPYTVAPDVEDEYYERWLEALETLLVEKGLLVRKEMEARMAEFAAGLWDHEH